MRVYSIEIFDNQFNYISSTQTSDIQYEVDYLDIVKNKIKVPVMTASAGNYINIKTDSQTINGIITGVIVDDSICTITYQNFMSICDVDVLFNLSDLSTHTMEGFIADIFTSTYISNSDALQNICGFSVEIKSGTSGTTLDLTENIANFYKDIVYSAFLQYSIVVEFEIKPKQKQVLCTIKKNISSNKTIEADLPNVINKKLEIAKTKESTNKLIIVNEDSQTEKAIYYLHTDNTISNVNEKRITPVVFDTVFATVSGTKTFAEVAQEKAESTLKSISYDNLIELEVSNDDELVNARGLEIGQTVTIISNKTAYNSIFTGKKVKDTTVLVFGAVRNELTKKLKWRV